MELFIKAAAGILITLVLWIALSKQGKDITLLLTIAVCCMVVAAALAYMEPVIEFIGKLQSIGRLDSEMVRILLKIVGIGLIAEVTELICKDAGNAALGKALQILATAVILWLSIPLLNELIKLIDDTLGAL